MWRSAGRCPVPDCNFQFAVASEDEDEIDPVAAAAVFTHAELKHPSVETVSIQSFRRDNGSIFAPAPIEEERPDPEPAPEPEERPRLVN